MSSRVFLDTVGLVAVLNKDDEYHLEAKKIFSNIGREQRGVVTTNFILGEVGNVLTRTKPRDDVLWLIKELNRDASAEVVHVDQGLFLSAADLYHQRNDKAWGLVDCISFSLMARLDIHEAFTADRHFQQAGYVCLLQ